MRGLVQDLRYGLRVLGRKPAFTATIVLTLTLGIGANTAIFSLVHGILLRPLPYQEPERLGMLWLDNRRLGLHEDLTSWPNYEDWKKHSQVFAGMAGFSNSFFTLLGADEPERLAGAAVESNFFSVVGVQPALGRAFTADENRPGNDRVVILSDGLWRRHFAADPNVVGRTLDLEGRPSKIIGVMPRGFSFPYTPMAVWIPLAVPEQTRASRGGFWLSVIGRLKPGVGWDEAKSQMAAVGQRLELDYPNSNKGYGVWVVPLADQIAGKLKTALMVLAGAVVFVLLIACANVSNLLLARAAAREREIAVRAALGAGRRRIVQQLLTESVLLSVIAGICGMLLALWGVAALTAAAPRDLPRLSEIAIDRTVLWFVLVASLASGLLFGLAPAFKIARADVNESLKEGGRAGAGVGGRRLRAALVVVEIALAVVLLAGAGLMIRSFVELRGVDPGFETDRVLTMRLAASRTKHPQGPQVAALWQQLMDRIAATPGVEAVGGVSDLFLGITPNSAGFTIEGRPPIPLEQQIEATIDAVTPGFFQALRVPLRRGRFFTSQDGRETTPVVVINETMARTFWPVEDPIGKRFKLGGSNSRDPWLTVTGVVGDMRRQGMDRGARSETFFPIMQMPRRAMDLAVRTSGDPLALAAAVRAEIRAVDKDSPVFDVTTLEARIGESVSARRFQMLLLTLFSALALALAAIGIYGVMFHLVVERTHEFGVRVALGAQPRDVVRLVMRQALLLAGSGVVLGTAGALALSRTMSSLLFGISATDPLTFLLVPLVLAAVSLAASYWPARRSTQVDPLVALRHE